jgi:hypothetical protein
MENNAAEEAQRLLQEQEQLRLQQERQKPRERTIRSRKEEAQDERFQGRYYDQQLRRPSSFTICLATT